MMQIPVISVAHAAGEASEPIGSASDGTAPAPASLTARGRPVDQDKRLAITEAARERFVSHGYEGLSLEAVAASAGVSKVTIYRAFGDRSGLLAAVVDTESQRMLAALNRLAIAQAPLHEQIFGLALELLTHLSKPQVQAFEHAILRSFLRLGRGGFAPWWPICCNRMAGWQRHLRTWPRS
jgi:AcrR family transcriptional regulator